MDILCENKKPLGSFENLDIRICRLCISQCRIYFTLLNEDENSKMLVSLTSIRISPSDGISTVMCLKCQLNLKLAYKIQQKILKAEELFYQKLSQITIKEEFIIKNDPNEFLEEEENPKTPPTSTFESFLPPETFPCEFCDRVFPDKKKLRKHRSSHKIVTCRICGAEVTANCFTSHLNKHNNEPQVCEECGVVVKNRLMLKRHKIYAHSGAEHKCSFCDRTFKRKAMANMHERKEHLGIANFVCHTCGKAFFTNERLNIHVKATHLKLRPHVCEFCKKGFASRFGLSTHRRQHTNETPYKCEVCAEGFKQNVTLKAHLRTKHNIIEENTCECDVCGKGFASKVALTTHKRVHS